MTRRGWLLSGAAGAALALSAAVPALRGVIGTDSAAHGPLYETHRVDFVRTVHAEGNLTAAEATQLGPPSRRRQPLTIAWLAPDGSRVREGDLVIRFDPTDMERNRDEGESERSQADSRISKQRVREESAVRNLERDAGMADLELEYAREFQSKDREIFSRADVIESEIDENLATERKEHAEDVREIRGELGQVELDLLAIERRKAELKVEEARDGLKDLEVRAPHDGIFVLKRVWGSYPEVGQMVWQGNAIAEIPQLDVMEAEIYVLEADAGGLEVDLPARVTLEAHPDRVYDARIKKIDALAQPRFRQVPVQYFNVVLELERTEPEVMKPGQRVKAELFLGKRDDVVTVPRQAIFESDGRTIVYALRGADFEPLEVELGPASPGRVVIDSGLEEGEQVALFDPTRPTQEPADEGSDADAAPGGGLAGSLR